MSNISYMYRHIYIIDIMKYEEIFFFLTYKYAETFHQYEMIQDMSIGMCIRDIHMRAPSIQYMSIFVCLKYIIYTYIAENMDAFVCMPIS